MSTKKSQNAPMLRQRYVTSSATFSQDLLLNFEHPTGASETIPDMTIDLRLMLNRRASGMPIPSFEAPYSEDDYPDFFKMDEFELAEYRLDLAQKMQQMSTEMHNASKALERAQDESRKTSVTPEDKTASKAEKTQSSSEAAP